MNDPFFIQTNKRKTTSAFPEKDPKRRKVEQKPQNSRPKPTSRGPKDRPQQSHRNLRGGEGKGRTTPNKHQSKQQRLVDSDEGDSDEEEVTEPTKEADQMSEEEDIFQTETGDEKRLRLAKEYLEKIKAMKEEEDSDEVDGRVDEFLKAEAFKERTGKRMHALRLASKVRQAESIPCQFRKCHKLAVTCVIIDEQEQHLYSGSKDCCIIKWKLEPELTKEHTFYGARKGNVVGGGHTNQVYALAVSSNGEFLASGGMDKLVKVWNTKTFKCTESLKGHRDSVTALTFKTGGSDLYSASADRSIKMWDSNTGAYLDTLYGHQSPITGLDSLQSFQGERCVTSASDGTTRVWKIAQATHLVFRSVASGNVDCVSYISEHFWVSGSSGGEIELWNSEKKKPMFVVKEAHGKTGLTPNWITAISALKSSDIIATGSCDGNIKLWEVADRKITLIRDIPMVGWVNSLRFSSNGKYLIAGIGQEPTLGRWSKVPNSKNGICVITIPS